MATPPVGPHQEYSMLPFNNHSDDKAAEGLGIDGMLLDGVDFSKLAGVGIDGNTLNDNLFAGLSLTDSLSSTYSNLPVSLNNFSTNPFGFDFFSASSIGGMTEGSVPISASASTDTNITEDTVTDDSRPTALPISSLALSNAVANVAAGAACTGVDSSRSSLSSSLLLATTEEEKASAPLTADLIDTTTLLSPEETNLSYDERIGDTATFTNDCTSPNVGSKKRNRINAGQLMVLEKAFTDSPSPSSKMRTSIAGQCHMTERSVQIWFQNRRAKARNAQRKSESPGSTAATALHTSASMFSGAVPLVMPGAALNFAALKTKSDLVNKTGQQGSTTIVNAPTTNTINNNNNNNSSSNDSDQSQSNVSSSHNSHNNSINIHGNNNSHNSKQPSNITTSQSNYSQIIFPIMTATATTNQQNQQQQQQQQTKLVNGLSNIMPPNIPMDQSYLLSNTRNINLVSNDVVKNNNNNNNTSLSTFPTNSALNMISNTPNLLSSVSTPNANLSMERITALRTAPTIPLIRSLSDTGSIPRSTSNLKSIAPARPLSNSAVVNNISAVPVIHRAQPILSAAIAPIPIPCNMLTIGTWRRISVSNGDLVCVYLPAVRTLRYVIQEQGVRFLLDYSANIILQMAVEINTNSNLGSMQVTVSGPPMFAMEMASLTTPSKDNKSLSTSKPKQATTQSTDNATNNKGKAVQRPSSPLALLTPPSIAPAQQQQQQQRPWMPCRDFTEKHQASQIFKYTTTAPGHALQESIQKIMTVDPGLRLLTTINHEAMNKSTDRHNESNNGINHDSFIQAKVESLMTLAPQSSALNRNNITGQMSGTNMAAATTATTPAAINTANMNRISSFGAINAKSYRFTTNGTAPAGCLVPVAMAQPSRSLPPVSHFQHQFRVDDPIEPVGLHTFSSPKRPATFTVNDKNARARLHCDTNSMLNNQRAMAMRRNWMPTQYDMSLVGGSPVSTSNEQNEPNSPALSIASANETLETVNDDDGTNRVQNHKMAASMAGRSRSLSAAIPPSPRRISQSINTMNNNKRGKRLQSQMKSQLSGSSSFTEQPSNPLSNLQHHPVVASPGGITAEQQQNLWLATAMMQQQQQQQQQQPSLSSFAPNIPLATIWAAQMNHNLASSAPNSSQLWQESKPLSDTNTTLPLNSLPTGQLSLQSTPQVNSNMNAPTMPNAGLSNMLNLQLNAPQSAPILEQGSSINTFDYAFGIGGGASSMLPSSLASTNGMSAAELDEATMAFIRDPTPPQSAGIAETSTSHGAISSPVDIPLANNTTGLGLELMDSSSITTTGAVYSNSNTAFYKGHFDVPTTTTTTANSGEGNHDMLFSSATMSADSIFDFSSVMAATNALPTSMDNHMIDSNTLNADQSTASMADISSTSATSASMFDQELPSADLQLDANDLFMLSA